jgi:hypothetical protein
MAVVVGVVVAPLFMAWEAIEKWRMRRQMTPEQRKHHDELRAMMDESNRKKYR